MLGQQMESLHCNDQYFCWIWGKTKTFFIFVKRKNDILVYLCEKNYNFVILAAIKTNFLVILTARITKFLVYLAEENKNVISPFDKNEKKVIVVAKIQDICWSFQWKLSICCLNMFGLAR